MPVKKNTASPKDSVKKFWILKEEEGKDEKTVTVVTEDEIINNPLEYMNAEIWDCPPYKYELTVSLKKVKV
ncbi:MAG: hypothetical protein CSB55_02920 [Candidatus Cloacimonadota bacterium]|nr:MAG: hypothetical protein CSB55_02920 [Candidatus Cloacimonadota bacterium]